jgi:hypothetical protein
MKKIINLKVLLLSIISISLTLAPYGKNSGASAAWNDNVSGLYYNLAKEVYYVNGWGPNSNYQIQNRFNNIYGNQYKIIDTISVNDRSYHPAGTLSNGDSYSLAKTGFKAMAMVSTTSPKLYIAFSGTDEMSLSDWNTSANIFQGDNPGQMYQAQLFLNYIYDTFPVYRGYNWYFVGHSLGGYNATKSYLDIRSMNYLNSSSKFKYGGAVKKTKVSGVFTFNPLPIPRHQVPSVQWQANKDGLYNTDVKNLFIQNEWLNGITDMHPYDIAYFGTKQAIDRGVKHYTQIGYSKNSSDSVSYRLTKDTTVYYGYAKLNQEAVIYNHSIFRFNSYVSNY